MRAGARCVKGFETILIRKWESGPGRPCAGWRTGYGGPKNESVLRANRSNEGRTPRFCQHACPIRRWAHVLTNSYSAL